MLKNILTFFFIASLFFTACNDKDSGTPTLPAAELKATINSNEWIADSIIAVDIIDYGPLPNSFEIWAYKKDGSSLLLRTNNDTNSVTILNVILSSFTSSIDHPESNAIMLSWTTIEEDSLQDFVLQKSIDGNIFNDVATIPAANKKNGSSYVYRDKPSLNDILLADNAIYYRLKMEDINNSFKYSNILAANPSTPALYIFPSQDYSWGFNGKTTITAVDKKLKIVTGSFNFKCVNDTTGSQFSIANGSFKNIPYKE